MRTRVVSMKAEEAGREIRENSQRHRPNLRLTTVNCLEHN